MGREKSEFSNELHTINELTSSREVRSMTCSDIDVFGMECNKQLTVFLIFFRFTDSSVGLREKSILPQNFRLPRKILE